MIDNQGKRLSALRNYIPDVVFLSLFGIAAVSCGFAGYASGLDPLRTQLPVFITAFLVCGVIFVILDLDRPNAGFITVSQKPMIDTVASLSAFKDYSCLSTLSALVRGGSREAVSDLAAQFRVLL